MIVYGGICAVCGDGTNANLITNCYNTGRIVGTEDNGIYIGGIIGHANSDGATNVTISNNYNIGEIEIKGKNATNIGGIIGDNTTTTCTKSNNYYRKGIYHTEDPNDEKEMKTEAEMKTQKFVDECLNAGLDELVWEIRPNENNGYPVIKKSE